MDHIKHYTALMTTRQNSKRRKNGTSILEKHHIVPRCLGGNNSKTNLVLLTPREHYIAHRLLYCMHSGANKAKMAYALLKMCSNNPKQFRLFSSKQYEEAKKAVHTACSGTNSPNYGKALSEAAKRNLSIKRTGDKNAMYGTIPWNKNLTIHTSVTLRLAGLKGKESKRLHPTIRPRHTEAFKTEMSRRMKGKPKTQSHKDKLAAINKGKILSAETRLKMSVSRRGKSKPTFTCPHCKHVGKSSAMFRWHFDQCKLKHP